MWVEKHGKRWRVRWRRDGKRLTKSFGTEADASAWLNAMRGGVAIRLNVEVIEVGGMQPKVTLLIDSPSGSQRVDVKLNSIGDAMAWGQLLYTKLTLVPDQQGWMEPHIDTPDLKVVPLSVAAPEPETVDTPTVLTSKPSPETKVTKPKTNLKTRRVVVWGNQFEGYCRASVAGKEVAWIYQGASEFSYWWRGIGKGSPKGTGSASTAEEAMRRVNLNLAKFFTVDEKP